MRTHHRILKHGALALMLLAGWIPLDSQQCRSNRSAPNNGGASIVYVNREYGFCFYLPLSWKGYSIIVNRTKGDFAKVEVAQILIRHPLWTSENPREDIPIEVFRAGIWKKVEDETVVVGAAPFPPSELGRNRRYVFALPARYDYDENTGVEEVRKITGSKPLRGFD